MLAVTRLAGFGAQRLLPTIVSSSATQQGGASSAAMAMPSGIQAGDLLVGFLAHGNASGTTEPSNAGWTKLGPWISQGGAPARSLSTQYRIADGSEGASMTFAYGSNTTFYGVVLCIRNFRDVPEVSAGASNSSGNADPDSVTPSWGSAPTLCLAGATSRNFSADPAGYSAVTEANPGGNGTRVAALQKLNGGSENPGAFANDSIVWCARTLAIRGAW
jgi:hypothetical protein